MRLGLISLQRYGPKVVTAKLRVAAAKDAELAYNNRTRVDLSDGDDESTDGLRLMDEVNGREHFPLRSASGECFCSNDARWVERGGYVDPYAKFPAPPADVHVVGLHAPGFPSFDDIQLDR